jgi:lipopolysaccharide transport system permease protein
MSADTNYEVVIEHRRGWVAVPWREIVQYRDLFYLMVRREFVVKYKQTILGPLWAVIQSVLTALVFVIVFTRVAKVPTDGRPPMVFYLSGLLVWTYFAQTLNAVALALRTNANLFAKVYFPRLVVPLAALCANLIPLAIQFGVFLAFFIYYDTVGGAGEALHPNAALLAIPLLLVQLCAIGLGTGLVAAALTVKYRDLSHLIPFLLQIGLYVTPVIYPLAAVPERWRPILGLNPLTAVIETFRYAFFGGAIVDWRYMALSTAMTALLLAVGLLLFNRVERTFVDTV